MAVFLYFFFVRERATLAKAYELMLRLSVRVLSFSFSLHYIFYLFIAFMKPLPLLDVVQVSEVLKQLQDCALSRAGLKHLKMFLYSCSFLRTPHLPGCSRGGGPIEFLHPPFNM